MGGVRVTWTNGGVELPYLGGDQGFGIGGVEVDVKSCGRHLRAEEDQDGEETEEYENSVRTTACEAAHMMGRSDRKGCEGGFLHDRKECARPEESTENDYYRVRL